MRRTDIHTYRRTDKRNAYCPLPYGQGHNNFTTYKIRKPQFNTLDGHQCVLFSCTSAMRFTFSGRTELRMNDSQRRNGQRLLNSLEWLSQSYTVRAWLTVCCLPAETTHENLSAKPHIHTHTHITEIAVKTYNKNLAIANRSRVSCAHNTSKASIVTPWLEI